jgi:ABC-2 type transport system permease protein
MKRIRFLTVTRRVFRDLRNDKRTLALIVIAPLFAMFIFGLAFSGEVKNVRVLVVNQDQGAPVVTGGKALSVSDKIISNLDRGVLDVKQIADENAALKQIKDGNAFAAIIFPPDFTKSIVSGTQSPSAGENATVKVLLDKSNINVANAITKTINDSLLKTMDSAGKKPLVSVDAVAVFGKNAKFMDFFVPGIMAFVVYLITTLLTLISFVGERTSGTLQRMLSTTLTEKDIVLGYAVTFSLVGMAQALLLLVVAILVFHITIVGNVLLAFVAIALLAIVSQAVGILLSSTAKREAQAIQVLPFVILPAFLLAGIFWPVEAIPSWLRPLSYIVPPTYTVDACRSVMLKGYGIGKIWIDLVALLAMAAFFLAMAVWSMKVRKD